MKTAIITGASAGLGLEFVRQMEEHFSDIESVWLIARGEEKLRDAAALLKRAKGRVLPLDICTDDGLRELEGLLRREEPNVTLLVNNAGRGTLGNVGETDWAVQKAMADLNVGALTAVTALTVPYMARGGHIINVSSSRPSAPIPE